MNRNDRSSHFGKRARTTNVGNAAAYNNRHGNSSRNSAPAVTNNNTNNENPSMRQHNQQPPSQNNDASSPPMEPTLKCMTVVEEGTKISFACYDEEKNEIIIEQNRINGQDTERAVQAFIAATRPNLVLISSKIAANAPLVELLTQNPPLGDQDPNVHPQQQQPSIPYQLLKSKAFDLKSCKQLILNKLRVMTLLKRSSQRSNNSYGNRNQTYNLSQGGHMNDASAPSSYHSLASIVDFDSPILLRALGALLCFLQGTAFRLEEGSTVTVNTIRYVRSSQYMRIDTATLHALHIFSTEHHPLVAKGPGKGKEGFSLYTLLDRTKSKIGKSCLKEWMLKPLLDPAAIRERQDGVELFLKQSCRETVSTLMSHLHKVGAVDKILLRMQKCHSAPMDFIVLSKTLSAAISIFAILNGELRNIIAQEQANDSFQEGHLSESRKNFAVVDRILHPCRVPVLQDLHERLVSIVDHEATAETKESVVIHYGFHEELDNAKEMFDNLDGKTTRSVLYILEYPVFGCISTNIVSILHLPRDAFCCWIRCAPEIPFVIKFEGGVFTTGKLKAIYPIRSLTEKVFTN